MSELTPTYALQSYLDTETEVSAAGIIEHLESSGFAIVDAASIPKDYYKLVDFRLVHSSQSKGTQDASD